jgi:Glycosyl hydrolase catalytic core
MQKMFFITLALITFLQSVTAAPGLDKRALSCPASAGSLYTSGDETFTIECATDHYGGDMPAPNGQVAANLEACIAQCVARTGCVTVQFVDNWACYLKLTINPPSSKSYVNGAVIVSSSPSSAPIDIASLPAKAISQPVVYTLTIVTITVPAGSSQAPAPPYSAPAPSSALVPSSAPAPSSAPVLYTVPAATESSAPATSSASSSGSGGCARPQGKTLSSKRGIPYNTASLTSLFGSKITWAYDWGQTAGAISSNLLYIPMLWGSASTSTWNTNAKAAIAAGSDTLLAFNEPDLSSQSNLTPQQAASLYQQYMQPLACDARLAAPAVTNGAAPMGLAWLQDFIGLCEGCNIDVVPIHWYDSATNFAYFQNYIPEAYIAGGNRTLWITEFGASGTNDQIVSFFQTALPWLDSLPYVERYSYFMAAPNSLVNSASNGLSTIGQAYASI